MHRPTRQWIATAFGGPEALQLRELPAGPVGPGEVRVDVLACGMNPADHKHIAAGQDPAVLPLTLGYEASGVVAEVGPARPGAARPVAVGDTVIVFQVAGAWASSLVVDVGDVFAAPATLSPAAAANLLLVGTTAAELLATAGVGADDTVLVHGAAGAVGASVLQQAAVLGARVVGTARAGDFDAVERFGGVPVEYGPGLVDRVRAAAPDGVTVALDTVGTDEAVDVSWELLADRDRLVSIAAFARQADGVVLLGAGNPASGPFRAAARHRIVDMAARGDLQVPMAATFPFAEAPAAVAALMGPHRSGKLALVTHPHPAGL